MIDMTEVEIILPFPPTVNSYYGQNKFTKYLTSRGKKFAEEVDLAVHEQNLALGLIALLNVEVTLFPPDRRDRDLDNYMKALLDSITRAGVWIDDVQIDQLLILRGHITKGGLTIVKINEAGPRIPVPSFAKLR